MKSTSAWVLASCLLVSCGGDDTTGGGGTAGATGSGSGGAIDTGAGGSSSSTAGSAGSSSTGSGGLGAGGASSTGGSAGTLGTGGSLGTGGAAGSGPQLPADENLCDAQMLTANKVIEAGKVTAICAGAIITASMGVSITVNGTLRVDGTAAMPVKFQGAAHGSQGWAGIVLASGGKLQMTYGEIHDAVLPVDAKAGSDFQVDHILIDNSKNLLTLASNGTINHGVLHGLGAMQAKDPILVNNASPHFLNTLIDRGNTGMDFIQVNGATSAAVFDYMEITSCHCAFHFNSGTGITISNSNIHGNSYGLMVEGSSGNHITHNNFTANSPNIGDCGAGSSAEVKDNYFQGPAFASNCSKLMSATPATAAYPLTGAGAVGPQP